MLEKDKIKWLWLIPVIILLVYLGYVRFCISIFMDEDVDWYREQYEVQLNEKELLAKIDSFIIENPHYIEGGFVRTWPHKFPKSMRPEPKPERLFKFGSGKDTVWVRLMFDSIGPNTTMVKVMDFNRKIKKNGIYYLWTPPINTYEAGWSRSIRVRREIQDSILQSLDICWNDKTPLKSRLGPLYTYPREWFTEDVFWIDAPKKRNKKNSGKSLKYETSNDTIKDEK